MRFYADPVANPPPGAEPLERFRRRVAEGWEDLCRDYAGRHVLVVGHAGVMRVCVALALDLPLASLFRIKVDNAAVTRIQCDRASDGPPFYQLLFHGGVL